MKILTGNSIREADRATARREGIASAELMERVSRLMAERVERIVPLSRPLVGLIGKGNNGGDGLAVLRILSGRGYRCSAVVLFPPDELSPDCRLNYDRLPAGVELLPVTEWPQRIPPDAVLLDALLGTGVDGPVRGPVREAIAAMNGLRRTVIAVDIPSGMQTEFGNDDRPIVQASLTLTVEFPKLSMLLPEAGDRCGRIGIVPLGLDPDFVARAGSPYEYVTEADLKPSLLPRRKFMHKGDTGHALLICGSRGMMGAAVLAVGAALRSGCGLVTAHVPANERAIVQTTCPSAMCSSDPADRFSVPPATVARYRAVGIGCGIRRESATAGALGELLTTCCRENVPMVLDADALSLLAADRALLRRIPRGSVLTPHLGELRRLVGEWSSERDKLERVRTLAAATGAVIVVKGAHSMVCLPDGRCRFNSTGNPGMAKGGSGDVLTGLVTGFIARGYSAGTAAQLGVYVHGAAGDAAAASLGAEAMNSRDLLDFLGPALKQVTG